MTSQLNTGNDRLSFDILGVVFHYYSAQESPYHPLETLLRVCHSWREAALGHRSIWGRINMVLWQDTPLQFYKFHILSRLARSGPFILLDIRIEMMLNHRPCNRCKLATSYPDPHICQLSNLADILNLLAGPDGDRCKQWRTFYLQLDQETALFEEEEMSYIKGLTYPMPALEELYLGEFEAYGQVFPSCPRLEIIRFDNVSLSTPMDIGNARHIAYAPRTNDIALGMPTAINLSAVRRLETFRLSIQSDTGPLSLPESFPFLTSLTVEGFLPSSFLCPAMASVTYLDISDITGTEEDIVTTLSGINFSQLQVLEIQSYPRSFMTSVWPYEYLLMLLTHLNNDILLKVNRFIFTLLLKYKWDITKVQLKNDQHTLGAPFFRNENLNVSIQGEEGSIYISKDESLEALVEMAKTRNLPPLTYPLDDLFSDSMMNCGIYDDL
jgi:hypothetical protein